MGRRHRIAWFGSAAALIVTGAICAAAVGGGTGQILALALIGVGLVLATSLVFLEVGLSEDKDRARTPFLGGGTTLKRSARTGPGGPRAGLGRSRGGLGRSRSHRRRLS
jgi:hypothetical protein